MIVRRVLPEEYDKLNALFSVAFETDPEKGPAQAGDEGLSHWGAFSETGELMSSLSVTPFSVRFDGGVRPMAGIGAVQTLPPYRRRGGVAACFAASLPELCGQGFSFAYLFPFSTAFYRRFGFESCVTRLACRLDLSQLRLPADMGSFRLAAGEEALADAVRTVDRIWETRWNLEVLRDEGDYDWLKKLDPLRSREYLYVCFDAADRPVGYTAFRTVPEPEGRNLVCSRFRFADREGFFALLGVFRSLAADHRYARFVLPSDPALPYLMGEWSLGAAEFRLQPAGMVRVIDARQVLLHAAYRGDGELKLRLKDPLIPANDGLFNLRFAKGRALSVEAAEGEPDAELEISAFSALIAGVCDFAGAAAWMKGVKILHPAAPFEKVFYRKSMMISEYF